MAGVIVPSAKPKESALDTVMKGLAIASSVYGIKADMAKTDAYAADAKQKQAEREQEKIAKNSFGPKEQVDLLSKNKEVKEGTPGAIPATFLLPNGNTKQTFLIPKEERLAGSWQETVGPDGKPLRTYVENKVGSKLPVYVKPDKELMPKSYSEKIKSLASTEKARFDHVKTYAQAVDEMEMAILNGGARYSPIGDNDFTAALERAAESYGRMQSGGAINKEEEARFKNMIRALGDDTGRTLSKLKTARGEADSRFETLGFSSNEVPEIAAKRNELEKLVAEKSKDKKSLIEDTAIASSKTREVIQGGWKYFLDETGKEVKPAQKVK